MRKEKKGRRKGGEKKRKKVSVGTNLMEEKHNPLRPEVHSINVFFKKKNYVSIISGSETVSCQGPPEFHVDLLFLIS